ncbi:MFS transporter [Sphingosinithalassobacter portus]|uniref:MFS transporter n=1 Tax=Stakelama portus TaxID=2676234 RepID=UPI00137AF31A|nr:MFS transporter [Sphingosinithalassobacter portus]
MKPPRTDTATSNATESTDEDSLRPLGIVQYRRFWLANMGSNFGAMIQTVAATWTMATLTNDPQMIGLVQTCASLPMMLVLLPAGALADIRDRRHIMLGAQLLMLVVAAALAWLSATSGATPVVLLAATFLIGCGTALNNPSWQASLQDLVPRRLIEPAANLNAVGFNVARSLGPAAGGILISFAGAASAFAVNAVSYLAVTLTLLTWRKRAPVQELPPESMLRAISAGLRYACWSPALLAIYVRASAFGLCGSAAWALPAVHARAALGGGPTTYGILLGGFGAGAILGALSRSHLPFSREAMVRLCSIAFAAALIGLGFSTNLFLSILMMAFSGAAWVVSLTGLGVSVQFITPRWVVGRALSLNQVSVFAGMALGSWVWGFTSDRLGIATAFFLAGGAMLSSLLLALVAPLEQQEEQDLTPARARPGDDLNAPIGPNEGPIVVLIEYRVQPENFHAFVDAMNALGRIRRRDGAYHWSLSQDVDDPTCWLERFQTLTWLEHLRRQTRHTLADREVSARVTALHDGNVIARRMLQRRNTTPPIAAELGGPSI